MIISEFIYNDLKTIEGTDIFHEYVVSINKIQAAWFILDINQI